MAEQGMHSRRPSSASDEFYVGYLPTPIGVARFVGCIVPALLLLALAIAAGAAAVQQRPGRGDWDTSKLRRFEGVIATRPYPLLRMPRSDGRVATVLIVVEGKYGGGKRAAAFDGQAVAVSGWLLQRDGRQMVELAPDSTAVEPLPSGNVADALLRETRTLPQSFGEKTLRGEIVDTKCWLGAMKPGEGKTHKECATLCIAGGIPPSLVTRDSEGRAFWLLLTSRDGGRIGDTLLQFVGDFVETRGELVRDGDLWQLRIDAGTLTRLN